MKTTPTHPELLAIVKASGLSDRQVERELSLPVGFFAKARKGGVKPPRAEPQWNKVRARFLAGVAPVSPSISPAAPPVPAAVVAREDEFDGGSMDRAIDDANTYDKVDELLRSIAKAIRRGHLTPLVGSRMIDALKEKRMVMEANDKQKATIASGATVVIRVEHVNDWRKDPEVAVREESPE